MICPTCSTEVKESDFFGKSECYKCVYKQKLSCTIKTKLECRICKGAIPANRRKFCSRECSDQAMRNHNKEYWVRNISIYNVEWN